INQIKHLKNNYSDSYLYDYENLDLLNTKQSFFQDGKSFDSFIKSEYLYFKNSSFYKNISKDEDTPEEIIKVIHNKLKSEELKNILEAYNGIKNTNLQEYIIFSKNTLYMLCAPRLNIDEATQEELEQIVWNINSKDILAYNGKTNIQHNIKEEKVYKTVFNAYIKDNQTIETSANTSAVFDEDTSRLSNIGVN
ncbi:hypothetical protein, partial [Aliarcobacter skirrowii]|uniref:hypothetical protein n=1 Tax=Aliarcobacter skirrowii TaxID=28200 RepID=UPI0029A9012A